MNSNVRQFALLVVTIFLTVACSSPAAEPIPTKANSPGVAITPGEFISPETTALPEETGAQKPFRVALVVPLAINDMALDQSMYDSLLRLQDERGGLGNFEIAYTEGMYAVDNATTKLREYASQGYDLVIAHGFQYGVAIQDIAPEFPNTSFAWGTGADTFGMPNVFAYQAASQEGGYVNGVIAATMSDSGILGVIGPIEIGDSKSYIDGFIAGAKSVNPNIILDVSYIGSFSDLGLSAETARTQIADGADALTGTSQMAAGAIDVAKANNVFWFGTQSNQIALAPNSVVSIQEYHWEVILGEMVNLITGGVLGGQTFEINLANGGEVMQYNSNFAIPSIANESVQGIIDGSITIESSE